MNHAKTAKEILQEIGGPSNVENVKHCVTRLRFNLRDESIAETEKIKKINGVLSVIQQSGQYQVVIGNEVNGVFDEVVKLLDSKKEDGSKSAEKQEAAGTSEKKQEKKGIWKQISNMISSIFIPVIGLFAGSGLIKAILVILSTTGVLSSDSSTYIILYAVADAIFYFFPVFLGYTAGKFFGCNPFITMGIGAAMLYPTIVASAPDIYGAYTKGAELSSFLGIPLHMISYANTVFPIIAAAALASVLEKLFKKVLPKVIQLFAVPACVLAVTFPITLLVIGPVVSTLSNLLAQATMVVYHLSPVICGLVLAGIWVFVIMFGLHWAFIPVYINNMMVFGNDPLEGLLFAPLFAYVGICLAIALKSKDSEFRTLNLSCAASSIFGVSEPALYGIVLPLKKPIVSCIVASALGGAAAGLMGTAYYGAGITGIFAITLAINPKTGIDLGFYGMIVSAVVALVVAFIMTWVSYKGELPGEVDA